MEKHNIEKFVFNNGKNITVLLPKGGQEAIRDELVDAKNPTMIVHALTPKLVVSIILPDESSDVITRTKLTNVEDSSSFVVCHGENIDLSCWIHALENLPKLIEANRLGAELEKNAPEADAETEIQADREASEYFNHIIGHMSSDQEYGPPFSCRNCKFMFDIDFVDGRLDFKDYDIKGRKFFKCPSCNQLVSKEVFIKSMRDFLLGMAADLDRDLEFIRGESSDDSNDEEIKNDYVRAINESLAPGYFLKIKDDRDESDREVSDQGESDQDDEDKPSRQSSKRKSSDEESDESVKLKKSKRGEESDVILLD